MSKKALDIMRSITQRLLKNNDFGQCMKNVQYISADNGNCIAEFTVGQEHLNNRGTLHGGCASTLIDCISSYALLTQGRGVSGVSVDLHVSFLKPARVGEIVTIDARTLKAGRNLAFLTVELSKKSDGTVIARGSHTKFVDQTTPGIHDVRHGRNRVSFNTENHGHFTAEITDRLSCRVWGP